MRHEIQTKEQVLERLKSGDNFTRAEVEAMARAIGVSPEIDPKRSGEYSRAEASRILQDAVLTRANG
jgi:hypothetical protein